METLQVATAQWNRSASSVSQPSFPVAERIDREAGFGAVPSSLLETDADGQNLVGGGRVVEGAGLLTSELGADFWLGVIHPADLDRTAHAWRTAATSGERYEHELRLCCRDGAFRWFLGRGVPIRDPDGNIARWIFTVIDIHDRKQAGLPEADAPGGVEGSPVETSAALVSLTEGHQAAETRMWRADPIADKVFAAGADATLV